MHRLATLNDIERIQAIERAAGESFRSIDMEAVADDDPISEFEFAPYVTAGNAWVATGEHGTTIAYILLERLGDRLHIEQITVHPDASRQGIGARLIDVAADVCGARKLTGLTLTTFRDVPWNAPYYERLGFAVLAQSMWSPELAATVSRESTAGLARWPRVVMQRPTLLPAEETATSHR